MLNALATFRLVLRRLLEFVCIVLMIALAVMVVVAVIYRTSGNSLIWYDEIASITLAWLTYYGAALAALRNAHLGFPNLVSHLTRWPRITLLIVAESLILAFFALLAYFGWQVVVLLRGDTLTSLPWIPISFTQSVIPIGALLYLLAEITTLPQKFTDAWHCRPLIDTELEEELAKHAESQPS